MATPARVAGVGAFVVVGVLLFAVGLFMIGDRQSAFATTFTVYTEFKKITGLQPGALVRVSGAKAGTVREITPPATPGEKFRVRLDVDETLHQLVRTDSIASIETEGLVGGSYLGISTGSDGAARLNADATIGGKEPFEMSDLMKQMGDTIVRVNALADVVQVDIEHAVAGVATTVDHANALLTDIGGDVKLMAASGAKVVGDAALITEGVRNGKGTLGKLVTDDELYVHTAAVAKQADEITARAREVVEIAKKTLEGFQSKDGPIQGMTADVKQTMDNARTAMAGFSENMDALKHNFLVRGFFKDRGYYDLAQLSPADYRLGVLTRGNDRQLSRVWLRSDLLFEADPAREGEERLSAAGRTQVSSGLAPFLDRLASGIVMVEGYAQQGPKDVQYLRARARSALVRDYLIATFYLDPQATGMMPLGADSPGSPEGTPWDGVALAVVLPKAPSRN